MTTKTTEFVICRACLGECMEYKSLYKQGLIMGEVTTLASLLTFCTDLEFLEDEDSTLPPYICNDCVNELAKSYVFKKRVLQANDILNSQLVDEKESTREEIENETTENVTVINKSQTDLVELAEAAQMKREKLDQQIFDNDEEYIQMTVFDNDETENVQSNEEQEENEMEYVVHDIAETTEIYHTTVTTEEEILDIDEEKEMEQNLKQEEVENEDMEEQEEKVEYDIQVHNAEDDYVELIAESQDGMSQHSFKCTGEDATNLATENYIGNSTRRRRTRSLDKPANPDHQCKVCGKQLSNSSSFKYHMKLHSDETPYKCDVCGEAFKTRNAYDGHISTHNPNNPNTCELCGKSYRQPSSLRMHMLTHSGVKPFTCNICGKSLTQKSGYKKHMLTHTGEKPYPCDICGKAFRISSNMLVHRRCHTDQKQFQCPECDKSFATVDQLKRHTLIHSDKSYFNCEMCGKQFKRQTSWRSHMKIHQDQEVKNKLSFELQQS